MKILLILWLVTLGWAFVPHAPNFSPVVAVCWLAAFWLVGASRATGSPQATGSLRKASLLRVVGRGAPIFLMAALLVSRDGVLALLGQAPTGGGLSVFSLQASLATGLCFMLVGGVGLLLPKAWGSVKSWAVGSTGAAVVFFISSNFLVWWQGLLYPPTGAGLWACYVAGLPFFHHTLASTALFSGVGIFIYNALRRGLFYPGKASTLKA